MQGAVLYGSRDVRFEKRPEPTIIEPTDAIVKLSATCICGSDLWPYRGANPITEPTPKVMSIAASLKTSTAHKARWAKQKAAAKK